MPLVPIGPERPCPLAGAAGGHRADAGLAMVHAHLEEMAADGLLAREQEEIGQGPLVHPIIAEDAVLQ